MSRYIVTTGSHYDPFTYDDIVKPLEKMAEVQNEAADAYDTLDMQTEALSNYISKENDPEVRARYDAYLEKLGALQDDLWKNGYNANTRRQLAAARAGYANDITAIDAAIKRRQDLSKAYRDARVKDPSLIQSPDPSRDSLDRYFKNDTYGTNWYSYSGDTFQEEVAKDAKNRAKELVGDDAYWSGKDPNLRSYLMQIITEGYSSKDVIDARNAVRRLIDGKDEKSVYSGLGVGAQVLTDVLYDHMNASGALNANLDSPELERLLNYGTKGLSAAIGETKFTNLNDLEWQYENDPSKNGTRRGSGSGSDDSPRPTYDPSAVIVESGRTKDAAAITKVLGTKSSYAGYNEGKTHTIAVPGADGTMSSKTFTDANDATGFIYHTPERDRILESGLDVALGTKNKDKDNIKVVKLTDEVRAALANHRVIDENGVEMALPEDADCAVMTKGQDGKWRVASNGTVQFNYARSRYLKNIRDIKDANPGLNIDEFAMSPEEEEKIRKKFNIDPDVNWRDLQSVLFVKANAWTKSEATLANHETKAALDNLQDWMLLTYNGGGPNGPTSRLAFRRVNPNTGVVSPQGEKNGIRDVLDTDKDGNIKGGLLGVEISPENMKNGEITVITNKGKFICSNDYLGERMKSELASNIPGTGINLGSAIRTMTSPIDDPEAVLTGKGFDATAWKQTMQALFSNETLRAFGLVDPRTYRIMEPDDIVRNTQLLSNLYRLSTGLIAMKAGLIRDERALARYQTVGATSTKPITYFESGNPGTDTTETETE